MGSDQETDPLALIPNLMRNGAGSSSSPIEEGRIYVGGVIAMVVEGVLRTLRGVEGGRMLIKTMQGASGMVS